jgi:hypothetical protein
MSAFRVAGTYGGDYREWPNRQLTNLAQLRAAWVELDSYKTAEYRHTPAASMVWHVLDRLRDLRYPAPSYIVSSGRGLHVVWLTEGVPSGALKAWQALQRHLNDAFADMGADRVAAPATANLRLAGTVNKGNPVRMVWPNTVGQIQRFDFRALSAEVLPYTPDECRAFKAAAAQKREARKAVAKERVSKGGSPTLTGETYWDAMERDLWRLLDLRYPAGVPAIRTPDDDGSHGRFLFALARIWAWRLLSAEELAGRVEHHAARLGYTPKAALREVGSIVRRLKQMAKGEARRNRPGTGLYRIGPKVLVKEFGITVTEAVRADLRLLVPAALKPARVAERQAKSRLSKGAKPRSATQSERLEIGRQALTLREQGLSRPQIAERLGKRPTYVDTAIREAKAVAVVMPKAKRAKAVPAPAPVPDVQPVPVVEAAIEPALDAVTPAISRGSSRYIADGSEASPSLVPTGAGEYIPIVHDVALPLTNPHAAAPSGVGGVPRSRPATTFVVPTFLRQLTPA